MVRNYKRKTNRENLSEDRIKSAVIDVIVKKRTLRSTAAKFCMPYSTLYSRVEIAKKCNQTFDLHNIVTTKAVGVSKNRVRQIFSDEEEKELNIYLTTSSNICYGLTYMQTRTLAYEFAKKLDKKIPQKWNDKKRAGIDWLSGFMKRHPLSLRKPENTSVARATSFNKANVEIFFKNYAQVLQDEKFTPDRIYNLDETSVPMVLQAPKVVASKGKKQVGKIVSAERGESITLCGIINATGTALPPVLIFPRVNFKDAFLTGAPAGSLGMASKSGYMQSDIFLNVLKHIQSHTQCSNNHKILLLIDNVKCHISVEAMIYARDNGIVILSFHPHTTHRMQPLDIGVFGPFKTYLKVSFDNFLTTYPGKIISIYNVASLLRDPYLQAFTPKNIQNSFNQPGIWPLNQLAFTDEDFLQSYATDRPITNETVQSVTELGETSKTPIEMGRLPETNRTIDTESIIDFSDAEVIYEFSLDDIVESPDIVTSSVLKEYEIQLDGTNSPCQTTRNSERSSDNIETINVLDMSAKGIKTNSQKFKASQQTLSHALQEIRPYPKAGPRKPSNRVKVKSTVYTNLEEIQKLVTSRAVTDLKLSKKEKELKVPDSALLKLLLENPGPTAEEVAVQFNLQDEYSNQRTLQSNVKSSNRTDTATNSARKGTRKRVPRKPRKIPAMAAMPETIDCQTNERNKNSKPGHSIGPKPSKKRVTKKLKPTSASNLLNDQGHGPKIACSTSTQNNVDIVDTAERQSLIDLLRMQVLSNLELAKKLNIC